MDNKKARLLNMAYDKLTILGDLRTDLHIEKFEEMLIQFGFEKQNIRVGISATKIFSIIKNLVISNLETKPDMLNLTRCV